MKKAVFLLSLFFTIPLLASALSAQESGNPLYGQIKKEAEKSFSALFNRKVTIESAGGLVVGQIELNGFNLPGIGRAQKVILNFNPLKYAYFRGDMVPALTKITVQNGEFNAARDASGKWNFLSIFPKGENGKAPPFRGRIIFKDCRVNYRDSIGFGAVPQVFEAQVDGLNGAADLRPADRVKFAFSGKIPEFVKAQGEINLKTGVYALNLSAEDLDLKRWGGYALPLPDFTAGGGKAGIFLQVSPPKTPGWAAAVTGKAVFRNASARFQTYVADKINGELFIADDNLSLKDLNAEINRFPFVLNGSFRDFKKQALDLSVAVRNAEISRIGGLLPELKDLDISGTARAEFKITGSVSRPEVAGSAEILRGQAYRQAVGGPFRFTYKDKLFKASSQTLKFFNADSPFDFTLDFTGRAPQMELAANFSGLDLFALAQNTPGIEGRAKGEISLEGPLDNLAGALDSSLEEALIFGQPLDRLQASFKVKDGNFELEYFDATSEAGAFHSRGTIGGDQSFDLQAEASGWRLEGRGIFGKMGATVERFKGKVGGKIGPRFLASPLRNLFASGEAVLIDGEIGEQRFDRAAGAISIGGGRIDVADAFIRRGSSTIEVSGRTGVGAPTNLLFSGKKIKLEDLKLLNHFLPKEAADPAGLVSVSGKITGELPAETRIASFDPLLDLNAELNLSAAEGRVAGIPVSKIETKLSWKDRALSLSEGKLEFPNSTLRFEVNSGQTRKLSGFIKGFADLAHFQGLAEKYGKVSGRAGINLIFTGSFDDPQVSASLALSHPAFNSVSFDNVTGSFNYQSGRLTLLEPLLLENASDLYALAGSTSGEALDLNFKILRADLGSAYRLFNHLQKEIARRFAFAPMPADDQTTEPRLKLNTAGMIFSADAPNGKKTWSALRREFEERAAAAPAENLGGKLTGEIQLGGRLENLSGKVSGKIIQGYFRNFQFDEMSLAARLKNQEIKIERALLLKEKGTLSLRGDYNLKGDIFLHLVASAMPLDTLQLIFPGKKFKGAFNMNAGIDGPIDNPRIALSAGAKGAHLAGLDFDNFSISFTKKKDSFYLHEFSLIQGNSFSNAFGHVLLTPPGEIDLKAGLKGNAIGLINLFTDDVKWIKGQAAVSAEVSGTLENPKIEGNIKIDGGTIYVKALDSQLSDLQGKAAARNNLLNIEALTGFWKGAKTREISNPLGAAGTIDLSKIFSAGGRADLNLAFSPTRLSVAFPNLYVGRLDVKEASLQGPLAFDFSEGPLLRANLEARDSVMTLSQTAPAGRIFPLNFAIEAGLGKNVYAVMGDVATLNLSNIFMNLEIAGEGIKVSGNLEYPSLLGKIAVKRGVINIFNREFTLLAPENQKKYFPFDAEKIQDNVVSFSGEKGPAGILPRLNLTSAVIVETQEKDAAGKSAQKKINILANLKGTLGAREETAGLKINLASFTEDKTKSPPEMLAAGYSEQDIKVMLLPDFIRSLAGLSRPEEAAAQVDSNAVIADYLSSRVQTVLFRSLEREAEQRLGLESLTLEYNLGPKVREAMGIKEVKGFEEEKPVWSVGFVKGFFDRVFIDVRYAQGTEQTSATRTSTAFNYQLTFKLTPIWSIIYYREPLSLTEITTGYQKATLKAGFSLW